MTNNKKVLGVDVGGVILDFIPHFDTKLAFSGENYLDTPEIEGAIDSLKKLNEVVFKGNTFLISKHEDNGPERILEWLADKDFFNRTKIPENHFYPCRERHEKAPIVKKLGITHFVDDRAEVLSYMIGDVLNLYLFQALNEDREVYEEHITKMHLVQNWKELMPMLMA